MNTSNLTKGLFLSALTLAALALLALVAAPTLAQAPAGGAGAQAWIENPMAGQVLPLGPVRFVVYATDAGGVGRIELKVNGVLLPASAGSEAPFGPNRGLLRLDQQWTPDKEGKYILEARGIGTAGGYGEPAFVDFCVGACQGAATPTPTPAPSPTPSPDPGQPVRLQVAFTADRTQLQPGECATLQWSVTGGAATAQINGQNVPLIAQTRVCPPQTSTFTLVVTGAGGARVARELTLSVAAPPPTATFTPPPALTPTFTPLPAPTATFTPLPPLRIALSADRTGLAPGECAVLQWSVQGDPSGVTLNGQPVDPAGQVRVCPKQTETYTLAAFRRDGAGTERAVTIAVQGITPPPERTDIRFWVDNDPLVAGSCTMLRWHVSNVQAYWVDGQPGAGDDGSRQICPCQTETHTLRVVKPDNSQQDFQVTVRVRGLCPTPTPILKIRPVLPDLPLRPLLPTATQPIIIR